MLIVKVLLKKAPMLRVKFLPKKAPFVKSKVLPKRPHVMHYFFTKRGPPMLNVKKNFGRG